MPVNNSGAKYHAKQMFQTTTSKGYKRYGADAHMISLSLHELEDCIRKEKKRTARVDAGRGIDYDPNITVYKGIGADADVYGVYQLTEGGLNRVGDVEAA